ncbi:hypothetical protein HBA54_23375 [Pelagibius litoralis]|uniref:Uncharacterized protein n=1 Tax=Pelagibius litoralis TaxID=374515 RepID=A0A967F213_9PROT|nr:hypothetical protein [Pelagibius litoralis]NIA71537.1 hypothetical protein [Pelagibius litoralis]
MRALVRPFFAFAILGGLLAACSFDEPQNRFADITYGHLPEIGLDVGDVRIEQAYVTPGKAPNVEHRFPVKPNDAAVRWAQDRLEAEGDRLVFRYIVREASAVETPLPTESGVTGLLTTDQSERYEARIVVDMEILDGRQVQATARAEARRSITVPEDITLKEREQIWYKLTENAMNDLNTQLEDTIRSAFFPYIVL